MSSDLQIKETTQQKGDIVITILQLEGTIDSHNHEQLTDKAEEVIEAGARNLVLDLGGLTYMSSAGLRAMHAIYNLLDTDGDGGSLLKIANPPEPILRLIKTIGFDIYVEVHDDLESAVNSF